jgi:PAS domain S-box-containing protein
MRSVFDDLSENLGLDLYFNYETGPNARTLRLKSYRGTMKEVAAHVDILQFGDAVCGWVAHQRRPLITENVQSSHDPKTDLIRSTGIQAYACYPLIAHGQLLGTLSFGSRRRKRFDDDELRLLETVATQIALSIERERHLARVREQAELMNLAQDMIMVRSLEGCIRFWNRSAEETYGWSHDEALGQILQRLLRTEFPEPLAEIEADLLAKGHWEGTLIHTNRAGRSMLVLGRWALQHDEAGEPIGVLEVHHDLTERTRIEGSYHLAIQDLERSQCELHAKVEELERFEEAVIDRELKMMELEREADRLCKELERVRAQSA